MKNKKASKGNKFFLSGVSSAFFLELLTNTYETKGLCPPWNEWKIERERPSMKVQSMIIIVHCFDVKELWRREHNQLMMKC